MLTRLWRTSQSGAAARQKEELFFLERKNQRTFIHSTRPVATTPLPWIKVFLLLFLQKKKILPSDFLAT
jgi:hypothetical protein